MVRFHRETYTPGTGSRHNNSNRHNMHSVSWLLNSVFWILSSEFCLLHSEFLTENNWHILYILLFVNKWFDSSIRVKGSWQISVFLKKYVTIQPQITQMNAKRFKLITKEKTSVMISADPRLSSYENTTKVVLCFFCIKFALFLWLYVFSIIFCGISMTALWTENEERL